MVLIYRGGVVEGRGCKGCEREVEGETGYQMEEEEGEF